MTVRDLCEAAGANVAAVNYHFGDKAGLYREVVDAALEAVRGFADQAMGAPSSSPPEERLRHYVRAHLVRSQSTRAARRASVIRALFRHELTQPTGAARRIIEQALAPRLRYLSQLVTELMGRGATPEAVRDCVMSVQAQCLLPVAVPVALSTAAPRTRGDFARVAEHVVRFSLAGIGARAAGGRARGRAKGSGRG